MATKFKAFLLVFPKIQATYLYNICFISAVFLS